MALSSSTNINASIPEVIEATAAREVAESLAARAQGELVDHSVSGDAASPTVTMTVSISGERLPSFLSSIIKNGLKVTITEDWKYTSGADQAEAELSAQVGGVPVSFSGTETLKAQGYATEMSFTGDVKSGIPLLGSKIAKHAEPMVERILSARAEAISAQIAK